MSDQSKKKLTPVQQEYQAFAKKREPKRSVFNNTLKAFLVGGIICTIGQGFQWFYMTKFAGAGASVPISSFGNALVKGALAEAERTGLVGVLTGIFEVTSAGISAAIIFAFLASLIFKPKG